MFYSFISESSVKSCLAFCITFLGYDKCIKLLAKCIKILLIQIHSQNSERVFRKIAGEER